MPRKTQLNSTSVRKMQCRALQKPSRWESTVLRSRRREEQAATRPAFTDDEGNDQPDTKDIPLTVEAVMAHNDRRAMESPTKDLNSWLDSSFCSVDGLCSGPSSPQVQRGKLPGHVVGLCLCCRTRWEMARHTGPVENKLLDHDPSSLSCDKWVLKKRRRPSKQPVLKSKLQGCLKRIQKQQSDIYEFMPGKATCSNAHAFLMRNLRVCTKVAARRAKKRKSTRKASTKRARRNPNPRRDSVRPPATCSPPDGSPADRLSPSPTPPPPPSESLRKEEEVEAWLDPANGSQKRAPLLVAMETKVNPKVRAGKEGPVRRGGFKDLLSQMRGNHGTIVREDRL